MASRKPLKRQAFGMQGSVFPFCFRVLETSSFSYAFLIQKYLKQKKLPWKWHKVRVGNIACDWARFRNRFCCSKTTRTIKTKEKYIFSINLNRTKIAITTYNNAPLVFPFYQNEQPLNSHVTLINKGNEFHFLPRTKGGTEKYKVTDLRKSI